MEIEKKLAEMGLDLPPPTTPPAHRSSAVRTGNLVFVGGHVPRMPDGSMLHPGKVGQDVTIEQGYEAAQRVMLNCLASLKGEIGDLDKVTRIVKLLCMVNSAPGFGDHPRAANGATDLLGNLYGERGRHARSAVGLEKGEGPNSACIEIEMIVEVQD
jgi:enamine deaminase RidA (YjgF/YER057c/UK114 family)